MKIRLPIAKKLFLSHFVAVVLVSGSIGTFFYLSAIDSLTHNLQTRLKNSAALVSQLVDGQDLHAIRDEDDVALPVYQKYLMLLRDLKHTNPDLAYLYVMRKEGEKVFFVIDTDETSGQALPGRPYDYAVPALIRGFSAPSVDEQIYTDEWGSFMSGYAPLKNGVGTYLVGMDMRADEVRDKLSKVRISGIISLAFSLVLAFVFSRFLSSHFTTPIKVLISHCTSISNGHLGERLEFTTGDELDDLIDALNRMSSQLEESYLKNRATQEALTEAKDKLEARVEERTSDLLELTQKLKYEIIERQRAEEALAKAAMSDPLTELLNRRAMNLHLRHEFERFKRNQSPFSVLLCDIDHFKPVNDKYGHAAGDQVLISVAKILQDGVRGQDLVARWGGEEFLLLLPDTQLRGATEVAGRLRKNMEANLFVVEDKEIRLTMSVGVCAYRLGKTLDDCINAADEALYRAKNLGRNRVEIAEEAT